jgi:thioredoxin 1
MIRDVEGPEFEELMAKADKPVILDFWAPWCGPCITLGQTLATLATDYEGEIDVLKVNVDKSPEIAEKYNARSVPVLVVVEDGEVKGRHGGLLTRSRLEAFVDGCLENA